MAEDEPTTSSPTSKTVDSNSMSDNNYRSPKSDVALVSVRIIRAEIFRNFETAGKMDPYATIKIERSSGGRAYTGRTRTHWDGHMAPHWNHICRQQPYAGDDTVRLAVWEDDLVGIDDLIGQVSLRMADLLDIDPAKRPQVSTHGLVKELDIHLKEEKTGFICVQAVVIVPSGTESASLLDSRMSRVARNLFESPLQRASVSGGSAPFYMLTLTDTNIRPCRDYYIGKDLMRAEDEVTFYEEARVLRKTLEDVDVGLSRLLDFSFEYAGIVTLPTVDSEGREEPRDLLVMRNLYAQTKSLRLLDVKIGSQTSQAGWQGKSRTAALRQSVIDGITNSMAEGFRLEGFDGQPEALRSMDPLLDLGGSQTRTKTAKKARRIMYQRMTGTDFLMYFLDVHQDPGCPPTKEALQEFRSANEVSEICLHEIIRNLLVICLASRHVAVPQKWIGSSVALGFETGLTPKRSEPEEELRSKVRVNIFDWGRSELNTIEKHSELSDSHQRDRAKFWSYYVGGVTRLAWDCTRMYWNHFGCREWRKLYISVVDFDSLMPDDFIGRVSIEPLEAMPLKPHSLYRYNGAKMKSISNSLKTSELSFSVSYLPYPEGSRLAGVWRVHIHQATDLPRYDKILLKSTCDPYVEVMAMGMDGRRLFRQRTSVKVGLLDPCWDETIEIPVAKEEGVLEELLNSLAEGLGAGKMEEMLLPELRMRSRVRCCLERGGTKPFKINRVAGEAAFLAWQSRLDRAAEATHTEAAHAADRDAEREDTQKTTTTAHTVAELLPRRTLDAIGGEELPLEEEEEEEGQGGPQQEEENLQEGIRATIENTLHSSDGGKLLTADVEEDPYAEEYSAPPPRDDKCPNACRSCYCQ